MGNSYAKLDQNVEYTCDFFTNYDIIPIYNQYLVNIRKWTLVCLKNSKRQYQQKNIHIESTYLLYWPTRLFASSFQIFSYISARRIRDCIDKKIVVNTHTKIIINIKQRRAY